MAEKELWKEGEKRLCSQEYSDIINKRNGMKLKPANFGPIMMGKYPFNDCWNSLPKWEQRHRNSPGWCSREKWDNVCECSANSGLCHTCEGLLWLLLLSHPELGSKGHWRRATGQTNSQYLKPMLCSTMAWAKVSHLFMYQPPKDSEIMVSSQMSYPTSSTGNGYSLTSHVGCAFDWVVPAGNWIHGRIFFLQGWEVDKAQSCAPISDFYYFFGLAPHSLYPVQFTRQPEIVVPSWRYKNSAFPPTVI